MTPIDVWINCPDKTVASAIAAALVERRLAAAVNIFPSVESRYRWKGGIETATEIPIRIKTRSDLFETVAATARALHPYETPSIHAVTAVAVTPDYLARACAETALVAKPSSG
jgi:periplasmic divalent cation tolerance protein